MTMLPQHRSHIQALQGSTQIDVRSRQKPLRQLYDEAPEAAWVYDRARTNASEVAATHPIHGHVICGENFPVEVPVSVHKAVGGQSDFPCPGEILAAALASCLDTAIRMIANIMGVRLAHLEAKVCLGADVRGTLRMGNKVPVGFQSAAVEVEIKPETDLPEEQLHALLHAAEHSCVILETLRNPPTVKIERKVQIAKEGLPIEKVE